MKPKIGDYIIFTRFGMAKDFKVGKVFLIDNDETKFAGGGYLMKLVYVHGIKITNGDGTQQLSFKAPVVITSEDEWQHDVIKELLKV